MKQLIPTSVRQKFRSAEVTFRNTLGLLDSDEKLVGDSQTYWNEVDRPEHPYMSHWRGQGDFADDARWLSIGGEHLAMFQQFAKALGHGEGKRYGRVIEWGCGGGANAVHFARIADEFVGVDIAAASLDECGRQLAKDVPACRYVPVLIDADKPEAATEKVGGPCDAFVSYYVFEALPTPEYACRVLRIAHGMLAAGGLAVIQVKYRTAETRTTSRRWGYAKNLARNTTFAIDEFWKVAKDHGFEPRMLTLVPEQPVVCDERYAYYAMEKAA
jgi:SAM-dependent methyltransferase